MKYHFHRDTILATIFLFFMLWLLSVTIKAGILEPGKMEPYDFDYTDVVYSLSDPNKEHLDKDVVIVNIGDTGRAGIAAILQKLNTMQPAAIGMDVLFRKHRDPTEDSILAAAITAAPKLVMCHETDAEGEKTTGCFENVTRHSGYANFYGEKGNVVRYYRPFNKQDSSFAAAVLHLANPEAFDRLLQQDKDVLAINYTRRDTEYLVIPFRALLEDRVDPSAVKNKIVLVGFYSDDPNNIEDKHLTPKNHISWGRSLPDMHGVIIHANTLSMMIKGNYIRLVPHWLDWLLAVILAWICTGIMVKYIVNKHIWFHVVVKVWQSIAIIVLVALTILMFKYTGIKADPTLAIVVLVFSAELLYLYEIVAMWMAKRFNHQTIFKHH